jgi:hypothetical protein
MNKVGFLILAAAVIVVSGFIFLGKDNLKKIFSGKSCPQVLTPAYNPETGELRDFSTPCDIPEGWVQTEYAE